MNASPLYRVASLGHRMHGQIVTADDVTECDACDGLGFWPVDVRGETRDCPNCNGLGVVLGYPTLSGPPTKVVLAEAPSTEVARSGESPVSQGMGAQVRPGRASTPSASTPSR